jgi:hypothetical protein
MHVHAESRRVKGPVGTFRTGLLRLTAKAMLPMGIPGIMKAPENNLTFNQSNRRMGIFFKKTE